MHKPFVSIVCPIYNSEKYVDTLIKSLLDQDYGEENYEILVVDNNSSDSTLDKLKNYPIIIYSENTIKSSYAARNLGILKAKGEIIALIDADCIADSRWLSQGVSKVLEGYDLVSGKVEFYFKNPTDPWELFDSIFHMNNEENYKKGRATTANLFIKKSVFLNIGLFNGFAKSGEDFRWTKKATNLGYSLYYHTHTIVKHPTRNREESIKKAERIAVGFQTSYKSTFLSNFKRTALVSYIIINLLPVKKVCQVFRASNLKFSQKSEVLKVLLTIGAYKIRALTKAWL